MAGIYLPHGLFIDAMGTPLTNLVGLSGKCQCIWPLCGACIVESSREVDLIERNKLEIALIKFQGCSNVTGILYNVMYLHLFR